MYTVTGQNAFFKQEFKDTVNFKNIYYLNLGKKVWDLEMLQFSSKDYIFRCLEKMFIGPSHKLNPKGHL